MPRGDRPSHHEERSSYTAETTRRLQWTPLLATALAAAGCGHATAFRTVDPGAAVQGRIEIPTAQELRLREPSLVDFATPRAGLLATAGGILLSTHDGGLTWTRVAHGLPLTALRLVTPERAFAVRGSQLLASADGGRHWRVLRAGARPLALAFADARHGAYVSGPSLFRTDDGGRTWSRFPQPCPEYFGGFELVTPSRGYLLCGGQPATIEMEKTLYATADGGRSWRLRASTHRRRVAPGEADLPATGGASGIRFRDAADGLMLSVRVGIYVTRDGGRSWRSLIFTGDSASGLSASWPSPRRIFAVLTRGGLVRSDDGGRSWTPLYPRVVGPPTGPVAFADPADGIGAGRRDAVFDPGALLATSDGGVHWRAAGRIPHVQSVVQLLHTARRTVWAVAAPLPPASHLVLERSDDAGRTWGRQPVPEGTRFFTISIPDGRTVFLLDDHGGVHRAESPALRWRLVHRGSVDLRGATFVSARQGAVVADGRLLATADGGRSWREIPVRTTARLLAFAAADARHWWLFGSRAPCDEALLRRQPNCPGAVLRTSDAGGRWQLVRLPMLPGATGVAFSSPADGWAGDPWSGPYRTTDGGLTWRYAGRR